MLHILCYAPYPQKRPNVLSPPPFSTSSLLNLYTSNTYTLSLRTPELIHPKELHTCKKILDTQVLDTPHYCTYTPNGLIHSTKYEILIRTYTLGNNWSYSLLNKKTINLCLTRKIWYYHFPTFTELKLNRPDFFLFLFLLAKIKNCHCMYGPVLTPANKLFTPVPEKGKLLHQFTPRLEIIHSPIPDKCTFHVMGQ